MRLFLHSFLAVSNVSFYDFSGFSQYSYGLLERLKGVKFNRKTAAAACRGLALGPGQPMARMAEILYEKRPALNWAGPALNWPGPALNWPSPALNGQARPLNGQARP